MAVFRVEKSNNYVVMPNHHLQDANLSLRAKGLLSLMLSLPDKQDYTLPELASMNRESRDAIRSAVRELEHAGYIERCQTKDQHGRFSKNEYEVRGVPVQMKGLPL